MSRSGFDMAAGELEGATPLGSDELVGLKFGHVTTREELNELEQANICDGLRWLDRARKTDVLSDQFLCDLHRKLFGDVWKWAGQYRTTGVNIGVDPLQIEISMRMLSGDAHYWAEIVGFMPPLEAAARYHHRMVQIHPFVNGNGRHARIAADLYLRQCFKAPPVNWAGGADLDVESQRRTDYITALRAADTHDYAPLLEFVGLEAGP